MKICKILFQTPFILFLSHETLGPAKADVGIG